MIEMFPPSIWPPPAEQTLEKWQAPNNGFLFATDPDLTLRGPADITLVRDGTLSFISNGLLGVQQVQALSIDTTDPPFSFPANPVVSIQATIKVLDPDPLLDDIDSLYAMGVDLSRLEQFAFYANAVDHTVTVVDVAKVIEHNDPLVPCVDCVLSLFQLLDNLTDPGLRDVLLDPVNPFTNPVVTGPFDVSVDPLDRFILLTTNGGIFALSTSDLIVDGEVNLSGELALFGELVISIPVGMDMVPAILPPPPTFSDPPRQPTSIAIQP